MLGNARYVSMPLSCAVEGVSGEMRKGEITEGLCAMPWSLDWSQGCKDSVGTLKMRSLCSFFFLK